MLSCDEEDIEIRTERAAYVGKQEVDRVERNRTEALGRRVSLPRFGHITRPGADGISLSQEENAADDRRDCQRSADAEIAPEVDLDAFGRGALGHDQVGHRPEQRKVARQGRSHGDDEPGALRVGERRYERLQREHSGHVADEVRQHRCNSAEYGGISRCRRATLAITSGVRTLRSTPSMMTKRPANMRSNGPSISSIDLLRLDTLGEQQESAADDRHLRHGLADEEQYYHGAGDEDRLGHSQP